MEKIDTTTDHMSIVKAGESVTDCIKEIVEKLNEIVEWINGQS